MDTNASPGRRGLGCRAARVFLLFALVVPARSLVAQGDTLRATAGVPQFQVGPPPSPSFRYVAFVNGVKIVADVPNLKAKQNNETPAQASQRKAAAIAAALNKSIDDAIKAGTLPAGTPKATVETQPATVPNIDRNGRRIPSQPATKPNTVAGYGVVVLPNVTGIGTAKDGARDPSGEGSGGSIVRPGAGASGTTKSSMSGTGSQSGSSTGLDPNGAPSFVSFGVYEPRALDADCTSDFTLILNCPGAFIAMMSVLPGMNDAQVLSALANLFNTEFAGSGFSASYDPGDDQLFIDQPLNNYLTLFTQSTDTGLELDPALAVAPEPSSLVLCAIGFSAIAAATKRRRDRGARRNDIRTRSTVDDIQSALSA